MNNCREQGSLIQEEEKSSSKESKRDAVVKGDKNSKPKCRIRSS